MNEYLILKQHLKLEKEDLASRETKLVEDQEYFLSYHRENDVLETEIEYLENQLAQEKSGFLSREKEWIKEREALLQTQLKLQQQLNQLRQDHHNLKEQMNNMLLEFQDIQNELIEISKIKGELEIENEKLSLNSYHSKRNDSFTQNLIVSPTFYPSTQTNQSNHTTYHSTTSNHQKKHIASVGSFDD